MSKKQNIIFNNPGEPAFIKRMKQQIGYKEPNKDVNAKRTALSTYADESGEFERDRDDIHGCEEDRPQIVQLKAGDLSKDEVEDIVNKDNEELEKKLIKEGKITFKKPPKRQVDETKGETTIKKSKQPKFEVKNPTAGTQNSRLLSFDDDNVE